MEKKQNQSTKKFDVLSLQKKQLEILHELDRVCKLCGVRYYLSSGTCLGALRHGGFIPWDDDIDVFMHWRDIEELVKNKRLFEDKYFIQTPETDPGVNTVLCRLRDSTTTCIMKDAVGRRMNHGVFIDIYALYPFPDGKIKSHAIIIDSFLYRILHANDGPQNHGKVAKIIGKGIALFYQGERRKKKMQKIMDRYRHNGGKNFYALYYAEDFQSLFFARVYPQVWFGEPTMRKFEDMIAMCPTKPEEYCSFRYGDNYMDIPPKEKRTTNHDYVIVDLEKPFSEYV